MKESSFQIAIEGLRTRSHDAAGMEYLRNLVPRDGYWQCPPNFTPFVLTGAAFPFPQVFRGENAVFVCLEDRIGILNETLQAVSWLSLSIAASGGPWSFCDWGPGYVFTNATNTVYSLRSQTSPYTPVVTRVASKFSCCCDHFGRLIYGSGNVVSWSSNNADDILSIVSTEARTADVRERREFGGVTMPWPGDALACKPLGDGVAIYGEDGVSFINPRHETRSYDLPFVAGLTSGVGIAGPLAVAGNEAGHVFLGTDGKLWSLSANREAQPILPDGEFLGALTSPVLTVDPKEDDLWVVDASTSYCMTKQGLGGPMTLAPYSITKLTSGMFYTGRNYPAGDAVTIEARSGVKDWGESGRNHCTVIQIGSVGLRRMSAGAYRKFSPIESWRNPIMRPCGRTGWARVRATGVQIKVLVKGIVLDPSVGATLHREEDRYLLTDKRGRRGTKIFGGAGRVMGDE